MKRLAVLTTHPIQYYAPWFRYLAQSKKLDLRVFYLNDFGAEKFADQGFGSEIQWDVPLLDGYDYEFVPNISRQPGNHHFLGLNNPALTSRVQDWMPDAALLIGYNNLAMLTFLLRSARLPLLIRGDSHRLAGWPSGLLASMKRQLTSLIFRKFRAFLAVGKANADYFLGCGANLQQIFRCPHCVDNDRFASTGDGDSWRARHNLPKGQRIVLFAGKFEPKKRPGDLLAAFGIAKLENTCLVFVGSGELETELQAQAKESGVDVHFIPFQNQSEMPSVYKAAEVLVLPSFGNWETWGLSVNEGMACGKPVIISSHVGCGPDLVIPGETGWIFPAGDTAALALCLRDALSDEEKRNEMGRRAKALVFENFSYSTATNALLDALSLAVSKS